MGSGRITQYKTKQKGDRDYTDESLESLNISSRYRIQSLKEAPTKGLQPQLTKGWAVTEKLLDSLQLLLIAIYPAIVRLGSGTVT